MPEPTDIPEITNPLEQPYVERQLIVVTDDAVVEASRKAVLEELQADNRIDWGGISKIAADIFLGMSGDFITVLAKEAFAAWSRARDAGINIVQISKSEAKSITFHPGHPRDAVLYIGHPAIADVYYTTAEFHRVTFEHKFAEAIRLLMHLGATEIGVEHVRGWSRDFSGTISVPIPSADASIGAEAGARASQQESMLFRATLEGTEAPKLPENLAWYRHEPTWQTIAEARVDFGLQDFSLSVTYNDDYGINAGLKAAVSKAGLDLGGRFEDHVSTEWRISGKFRPQKGT